MKREKEEKETYCPVGTVSNDAENKILSISDGSKRLMLELDYGGKCLIRAAWVKERQVLSGAGVYSAVKTADGTWYTTRDCAASPVVKTSGNTAEVSAISYGGCGMRVVEDWTFTANRRSVSWEIRRSDMTGGVLSDTCVPEWNFQGIDTWTGAVLDNGGVAWMKLLDADGRTLGTHAGKVTFWDKRSNSCLEITPDPGEGVFPADRFTKRPDGALSFCSEMAPVKMTAKYDLQNFRNADDVWAPFSVGPGTIGVRYELSVLDYDRAFDIGTLAGLDGSAVREMGKHDRPLRSDRQSTCRPERLDVRIRLSARAVPGQGRRSRGAARLHKGGAGLVRFL